MRDFMVADELEASNFWKERQTDRRKKAEMDKLKRKFPDNFFKWLFDVSLLLCKEWMIEWVGDADAIFRVEDHHFFQEIDAQTWKVFIDSLLSSKFGEGRLSFMKITLKWMSLIISYHSWSFGVPHCLKISKSWPISESLWKRTFP